MTCHVCRRDLARSGRSGSRYCRLCNGLVNPGGGRHYRGRSRGALYGRATTWEDRERAAKALHRDLRGFGVGWGRHRPQRIPRDLIERYARAD